MSDLLTQTPLSTISLFKLSLDTLEATLSSITTTLTCPICQDLPTHPYILPSCGHSFCYSCIKSWLECNPSCPICRKALNDKIPVLNQVVKGVVRGVYDGVVNELSKRSNHKENEILEIIKKEIRNKTNKELGNLSSTDSDSSEESSTDDSADGSTLGKLMHKTNASKKKIRQEKKERKKFNESLSAVQLESLSQLKQVISWKYEKDFEYKQDEVSGFIWIQKLSKKFGRAVVDNDDGVPRCSACHWELVDGQCENCGRTMIGWQDRDDGENLYEDDGWEEESRMRRSTEDGYSSGLVDEEAYEDDDEEEAEYSESEYTDWGEDEELPSHLRREPVVVHKIRTANDVILVTEAGENPVPGAPIKVRRRTSSSRRFERHNENNFRRRGEPEEYESDDGFVVDDGDIEEDEDEDDESILPVDDELASGDEDLLDSNRHTRIDSDEDLINHRPATKPIVLLTDDEEEDSDEENDAVRHRRNSHRRKTVIELSDSNDSDDLPMGRKRSHAILSEENEENEDEEESEDDSENSDDDDVEEEDVVDEEEEEENEQEEENQNPSNLKDEMDLDSSQTSSDDELPSDTRRNTSPFFRNSNKAKSKSLKKKQKKQRRI